MHTKTLTLIATIALGAVVPAGPVRAHDDGLTCHDHPARGGATVLFRVSHPGGAPVGPSGTGKTLTGALLGHALGNHVARDSALFDLKAVAATHAAIGEFEEMVEAVRLLVIRAERLTDPADFDRALLLAEETLYALPLGELLALDAFLEENRDRTAVVVPLEILTAHLRESGTPDDLVTAVEDSANGC